MWWWCSVSSPVLSSCIGKLLPFHLRCLQDWTWILWPVKKKKKTCQPVPSLLFLTNTTFSFLILAVPQVLSHVVATKLPSLPVELIHPSPSASKMISSSCLLIKLYWSSSPIYIPHICHVPLLVRTYVTNCE